MRIPAEGDSEFIFLSFVDAREPRKVLAEVGVHLPKDTEMKVWDSSGTARWFVIPERPAATEDFTEHQLMELVATESMMGVALAGARS